MRVCRPFSERRLRRIAGYNRTMTDIATDPLSPLGHSLLKLHAGKAYALLTLPVAHAGSPDARAVLEMLHPDQLLATPVKNQDEADAMLAGLWLYHDMLEPSHLISQSLRTASGSLWHAILHRREGDFSNARYWYRKAPAHPMLAVIGNNVALAINPLPADKSLLRLLRNTWDPCAFVDLVEEITDNPADPRLPTAQMIQRLEWQLLFDHCTRQAAGH